MTTFQKLKHEARRAEQRSDWARAIDLYQRALKTDEDMADLSLYNRIGDLYLRLGQNDSAVESYERAIDRYADNGMHTSAIALCNKILRIAPGRYSVYRRLGLLHARTGLVVEGRAACLTFVRQSLNTGATKAAAAAIEEFVAVSGDEHIRLAYSEALAEQGDLRAAADELRDVIRERTSRGVDTSELAARLDDLVPGNEPAAAEEPAESAAPGATPGEVRLAHLVAARLSEAGNAGTFEPERTTSADDPTREARDGLEGVRRELARFRQGVEDTLAVNDLTVRYDLGVEFMTIGLLDEAIEEFQVAVGDPGLVEAANARIGECLALRTSGLAFETVWRHAPRAERSAPRAVGEPVEKQVDEPEAAEPEAAEPEPAAGAEAQAEVDPGAEAEAGPEIESGPGVDSEPVGDADRLEARPGESDDELEGHFFRARLAQYRVRRAEERHTTDHAAHLDLGSAYVQMDLHQEALRELCVAFEGPRPVSGRAARALKRLALLPDVAPELAIDVIERLAAADSGAVADTLGAELAVAWGAGHPMAERLSAVRGRLSDALADLPALEDMFPGLGDDAPQSGPGSAKDETMADGEADPAPESGGSPDVTVVPIADGSEASDALARRLARANELAEAGAREEATELLDRSLAELEEQKRTRDALSVLDQLLELNPGDIDRHEKRTELAGMVNDHGLQVTSLTALGDCLRRHGEDRRARAAYGRILDLDDTNEPARQAIARIDADELEAEQQSEQRRRSNGRPAKGLDANAADGSDADAAKGSNADAADVEALLGNLESPEVEADAAEIADVADSGDADDDTARSQVELGLAFRQMGMWEEAVRELRAALGGVTDRLEVLEALGECLLKAGHPERAVDLLASNLRSDEDAEQVAPLYFLGLALQATDEPERAREVFGRVEAVRPGYRDAAERLSELSL